MNPIHTHEKKDLLETATFAGGCFWCTEAVFSRILGVQSVIPGYSGGTVLNPTYEQVCMGTTGHVEAIQMQFQPEIVPYKALLDVFFAVHDPTTKNRQGADIGSQYRSVIFYHSLNQKKIVEEKITELETKGIYSKIVTELVPSTTFYQADNYHKNYYEKNSYQPYCQVIIDPKINKLFKEFSGLIDPSYQ